MELYTPQQQATEAQLKRLLEGAKKREIPQSFSDPIREFKSASRIEGTVRNWLTYPLEERKRLVRSFTFVPRRKADPRDGIAEETEQAFATRENERWRGLCVIIQEESRWRIENDQWVKGSAEVAIGALKQLFPEHDWKPAPGK